MQSNISRRKVVSTLPRVPIDDSLMTIMLLNEQPIIAIAADVHRDSPDDDGRGEYCHLIRVDEAWTEA